MSALPGVIGGAAAAYGAYALSSNVGTTAVAAVAGCLVADFIGPGGQARPYGIECRVLAGHGGPVDYRWTSRRGRVYGIGGAAVVSGVLRRGTRGGSGPASLRAAGGCPGCARHSLARLLDSFGRRMEAAHRREGSDRQGVRATAAGIPSAAHGKRRVCGVCWNLHMISTRLIHVACTRHRMDFKNKPSPNTNQQKRRYQIERELYLRHRSLEPIAIEAQLREK